MRPRHYHSRKQQMRGGVSMRTGRTKTGVCLGFLVALLSAKSARADVIEIRPDGSTVTYSGPSTNRDSSGQVSPLQAAKPSRLVGPTALPATLRAAANRREIAEALIGAVAWQESHWRQSARSAKGAR